MGVGWQRTSKKAPPHSRGQCQKTTLGDNLPRVPSLFVECFPSKNMTYEKLLWKHTFYFQDYTFPVATLL